MNAAHVLNQRIAKSFLLPTTDRLFDTKVKCPTKWASYWVTFPTLRSLTRVKCSGITGGGWAVLELTGTLEQRGSGYYMEFPCNILTPLRIINFLPPPPKKKTTQKGRSKCQHTFRCRIHKRLKGLTLFPPQ